MKETKQKNGSLKERKKEIKMIIKKQEKFGLLSLFNGI